MNKRLYYAIKAAAIAKDGETSYTSIHGLQAIGMTCNFGLETVQEIGELKVYEQIDNMPEVELTLSKVLDGYPLIYHLATRGAPANSLVGRSNQRCIGAVSYFLDTQASASGDPISTVTMSGLFVQSLSYNFDVGSNSMEEVTLVGNSRTWKTSAAWVYTGGFLNNDTPLALASGWGGVQRRENVRFNYAGASASLDSNGSVIAPSGTILPQDIYGISSSGTNDLLSNFEYSCSVQSIRASVNTGRENLMELGHKLPYHRFISFPVQTTCEITVMAKDGDRINATENTSLSKRTIKVASDDSFFLDMGTENKLATVSTQGGDATGGNDTHTYTYQSYNDFTVSHILQPS